MDDDVHFELLTRQISLLIMDDEEPGGGGGGSGFQPVVHFNNLYISPQVRLPNIAPFLIKHEQCGERERKGTGVFIPGGSAASQKKRKGRRLSHSNGDTLWQSKEYLNAATDAKQACKHCNSNCTYPSTIG
ncbi:hypothetical protein AMTRI_Chr01g114900 [Amborella trichopoda]